MGFITNLFTGPYAMLAKWGIIALLLAAALTTAWVKGNEHGTAKLDAYIGKQAIESVALIVKQGKATVKVVNRYIQVAGATQVVTETVEKEVIKYAETNTSNCLDPAWRVLHDSAALNTLPGDRFKPDETVRAPEAAATIKTVTENYGACNRTADRLDALQEWVRAQQAVR